MKTWSIEFEVINKIAVRPATFWGSVMHGMLIEHLPDIWKEALHEDAIRPFSQWVCPKDEQHFIWHMHALNAEFAAAVEDLFAENRIWHSEYLHADMKMVHILSTDMPLQQYTKEIFTAEAAPERIKLTLKTTASHKVMGQYALFPSVELIAGSIRRHIMVMDEQNVLGDDDVFDDIINHTKILKYKLQSATYNLEGARIYGYWGSIELGIKGPDSMRRLAWMLFGFADYCGIGIKTALGMGGCETEIIERRNT